MEIVTKIAGVLFILMLLALVAGWGFGLFVGAKKVVEYEKKTGTIRDFSSGAIKAVGAVLLFVAFLFYVSAKLEGY